MQEKLKARGELTYDTNVSSQTGVARMPGFQKSKSQFKINFTSSDRNLKHDAYVRGLNHLKFDLSQEEQELLQRKKSEIKPLKNSAQRFKKEPIAPRDPYTVNQALFAVNSNFFNKKYNQYVATLNPNVNM